MKDEGWRMKDEDPKMKINVLRSGKSQDLKQNRCAPKFEWALAVQRYLLLQQLLLNIWSVHKC